MKRGKRFLLEILYTENPNDKICASVIGLYVFSSFDELYKSLPLLECGYTKKDIDTASPRDMKKYYSKEAQQQCGVVGIKICI